MRIRSLIRTWGLVTGLACGGASAIAASTEATTTPATAGLAPVSAPNGTTAAPATVAAVRLLWLEVARVPGRLEPELLRAAIERELQIPVTLERTASYWGHVQIASGNRSEVVVRYESADGTTKLERRVALPVDASRQTQVISWVTGNLVRNEAAEILAEMANASSVPLVPTAPEAATAATAESTTLREDHSEAKPEAPAIARPITPRLREFRVAGANKGDADWGPTRLVHAALFSPWVGVDADAAKHRYHLSFGGFYSQVGALDGFGLGMLVDRLESASKGVQVSGLWLDGAAHHGVLVAGLAIRAREGLEGVEIAGAVTLRSGSVTGVQIAGGANVAGANLQGLQLSGAFNGLGGDLKGLQINGGVNVARDVRGMQFGLVNVGRDVDGLQFGLVNVARKNRGIALGLFNWSDGARLQPTYFFQNPGYHNVGYRNRSGYATSAVSFGYDESRKRARTHFAMGAAVTFGRVALGAETGYGWVLENMTSGPTDRAHELDLIGTVTVDLLRNRLSVFGGGGVALPVAGVVPIEPHGLAQVGFSVF